MNSYKKLFFIAFFAIPIMTYTMEETNTKDGYLYKWLAPLLLNKSRNQVKSNAQKNNQATPATSPTEHRKESRFNWKPTLV